MRTLGKGGGVARTPVNSLLSDRPTMLSSKDSIGGWTPMPDCDTLRFIGFGGGVRLRPSSLLAPSNSCMSAIPAPLGRTMSVGVSDTEGLISEVTVAVSSSSGNDRCGDGSAWGTSTLRLRRGSKCLLSLKSLALVDTRMGEGMSSTGAMPGLLTVVSAPYSPSSRTADRSAPSEPASRLY